MKVKLLKIVFMIIALKRALLISCILILILACYYDGTYETVTSGTPEEMQHSNSEKLTDNYVINVKQDTLKRFKSNINHDDRSNHLTVEKNFESEFEKRDLIKKYKSADQKGLNFIKKTETESTAQQWQHLNADAFQQRDSYALSASKKLLSKYHNSYSNRLKFRRENITISSHSNHIAAISFTKTVPTRHLSTNNHFQPTRGNYSKVLNRAKALRRRGSQSPTFLPKLTSDKRGTNIVSHDYYQLGRHEVYLYSAFVDDQLHLGYKGYLRIFGVQNRTQTIGLKCSLYSLRLGRFVPLQTEVVQPIDNKWPTAKAIYQGYYYGYVITAELLTEVRNYSVNSSSNQVKCELNNFSVTLPYKFVNGSSRGDGIGLCLRAMWGDIDPLRLVEWIEFNLLLGVKHLTLYTNMSDNTEVTAVLTHYKLKGIVTTIESRLVHLFEHLIENDPIGIKILQREWLMEQLYLVNINDCLYNYANIFKYVAVIDLDEILIPGKTFTSLTEVVHRLVLNQPNQASYLFNTVWHFQQFGKVSIATNTSKNFTAMKSNVAKYSKASGTVLHNVCLKLAKVPNRLHMMNYRKRTHVMYSQPKSIFVSGSYVLANWHSVMTVDIASGSRGNFLVKNSTYYGVLHHFRNGCKHTPTECAEMINSQVLDQEVFHYKELLEKRVLEYYADFCGI